MGHYCLCLFIGLLAVAFLQSGVLANNANMPGECCFDYYPRKIPITKVNSYIVTRPECTKPGVILVTQKGFRICVNTGLSWVKNALKKIDDRNF
ncbi:C-C motif chemokine 36.1 [Pimephales promelas]|uniref:C-C motif chemokine 36.1 n=1 Tax=Pimephales promelas TaxID=90988 RepID=UPI0019559FEB|nr:C-C motif chemokine 36.1 [Pimephales promelas]KAG1960428.1 C-C motif chemokine [Pimephales promelas]